MSVRCAYSAALLLLGRAAAARTAWREVSANGTWPQPRFSHTAVVGGQQMLMFGGNNFDAVNELYSFNFVRHEWSKLKPSGEAPSRRYGHASVLTADGRMVVFGGYNGSFLSDVHVLSPAADGGEWSWRHVAAAGGTPPCGRDGHSAVLAPDGRRVLVFGGFDGKRQLDDVHVLDTATFRWTRLELEREAPDGGGNGTAPGARYLHSAVACDGGMLVYGGYLAGGDFGDDLWRLSLGEAAAEADGAEADGAEADGAEADGGGEVDAPAARARWTRVETTGDSPGELFGHASASDAEGRLWVSGGFGGGAFSGRLHVLEPRSGVWSRVEGRGKQKPSPRHKHSLVAVPGGRLLLFGGNDFGPTRGFYQIDAAAAAAAAEGAVLRRPVSAGAALMVQGTQVAALVGAAVSVLLHALGVIPLALTLVAVRKAAAFVVLVEMMQPAGGGLLRRKQAERAATLRSRLEAAQGALGNGAADRASRPALGARAAASAALPLPAAGKQKPTTKPKPKPK